MRVPLSWLRDYVAWDGSAEELAELLSMSGSEVEGIDWVGAPHDADNLARFRVGRVLTKERHPNADKLWLCTVDVGEAGGGVHQIVCGAQNFAAGDTVAVSLAGATLENGLKLRKANLRGVESNGMMLSEQELGFEQASPGIMVLPADWPVGAPLADYLPVAEPVLEIEVTPNRPDCLSIYGMAREVAAAAGLPLAPPPVDEPPTGGAPADAVDRRRDRRPRPVRALRRARHARRHGRRLAGLAQGAAHPRRHAPHQQRGRRHQLRAAGRRRTAARLRRRQHPRRQARRAPRPRRRTHRHPRRRRACPCCPTTW